MSKIDELIKELCPNGVEWKKLGEVCQVLRGKRLTKSQLSNTGKYKVFHGGIEPIGFYRDKNREANTVMVINVGASAGTIGFSFEDFWSSDGCFCVSQSDSINSRFLYFFFLTVEYIITAKVRHAGIPTLDSKVIEDLLIPLPPLPIQEEIVRILDKFVEQQEQLEQLIELRKKQYEYYREELLTPKEGEEWETKTLGGIFEMRNGYTPSKSNLEFWSDGDIPWFRMEDIREKGRYLSDSSLHITDKAIRGKGLFRKNTLILSTSATIGEHALLMIDALANQRFTNLKIKNAFENKVDIEYMYYYMFIVDAFCKEHTNKSGFESVDMVALKNMDIHFPNLAKQREIVTILQKSEVSINSLMDVLESCKDRNTHYRDQLLRF